VRLLRLPGSGLAGWVSPIFCPPVFEFSIEGLAALGSGRGGVAWLPRTAARQVVMACYSRVAKGSPVG
jgi:hypothetical protein